MLTTACNSKRNINLEVQVQVHFLEGDDSRCLTQMRFTYIYIGVHIGSLNPNMSSQLHSQQVLSPHTLILSCPCFNMSSLRYSHPSETWSSLMPVCVPNIQSHIFLKLHLIFLCVCNHNIQRTHVSFLNLMKLMALMEPQGLPHNVGIKIYNMLTRFNTLYKSNVSFSLNKPCVSSSAGPTPETDCKLTNQIEN